MSDPLYCEPCQRFLRGDLSIVDGYENEVVFEHHLQYASFQIALQLPCSICSLAWADREGLATEEQWGMALATYRRNPLNDDRLLYFVLDSIDHRTWSSNLYLKHLSSDAERPCSQALPSNTRDSLPFLLKQYKECCAQHPRCRSSESMQIHQYPTRILDVGTDGCPIRLRSTEEFSSETYACLSHCWGMSRPYTLTAMTRPDLEAGIDAESLPKTFQHAIEVTRRLAIQYLWIDSLCILQDSESDWASESSRMGEIYAQAACTIAATASTNSEGGLFYQRLRHPLLPRLVDFHFDINMPWLRTKHEGFDLRGTYICDVEHMATSEIEYAPLNMRAWVSQERQLSCRIMHFGDTQLFWECHQHMACETYPNGVSKRVMPAWSDDATMLKRRLKKFKEQDEEFSDGSRVSLLSQNGLTRGLYWAWCSFRRCYSSNALSQANDKLVALSGIAEHVSRATGDEIVAGLWKSRIVEELCWFKPDQPSTPHMRVAEWRAPTWSWAATEGTVWISTLTKLHGSHRNRHFEIDVVDIDVGTKVSGSLTHGSMRINGKPLSALIISKEPDFKGGFNAYLRLIRETMQPPDATIVGDGEDVPCYLAMDAPETFESKQVYLVVVQRCIHEEVIQDGHRYELRNSDGSITIRGSDLEQGSVDKTEIGDIIESKESDGNSMSSRTQVGEMPKNCDGDADSQDEGTQWQQNLTWRTGELEGLLLEALDEDIKTFSRIGLVQIRGLVSTQTIMSAHWKAEQRIITLI